MVKREAIKPSYFADIRNIRSLKIKEKVSKDGADPEEALLHSLSLHEGWRILKDFIDSLSDDLDSYITAQMEAGASFEVIGQNTVTVQLCKDILRRIVNKVTDAQEAIEEQQAEKRAKTGK